MKHAHFAIVAAMATFALSAPSQAAVLEASSSITLSGLTFSLVDLDPTDGVAPSMQVLDGDLRWESVAELQSKWSTPPSGIVDVSQSQPINSQSLLMPAQARVGAPSWQSSAEITASSIAASASTTMDAATAQTGESQSASAYTSLIEGRPIRYTLSANTALLVEGRYDLSATVKADESVGYGYAGSYFALLGQTLSPDGEWLDHVLEDYIEVWALPGTESKSDAIHFMLANDSAASQTQQLTLTTATNVSVTGLVSEVPEPAFMSLMLAGLGVIGIAAKSRRQRPH